MMKLNSIKYKTLFAILFVCTISIIIGASSFLIYSLHQIKKNQKHELLLASELTGENLIIPLAFNDSIEAGIALKYLETIEYIENAVLLKEDRSVFCSYSKAQSEAPMPAGLNFEKLTDKKYWFNSHTIKRDGELYGYLIFTANNNELQSQVNKYLLFLAFSILFMLVASSLLAMYFARRITKPIFNLVEHADTVRKSNDYDLKIESTSDDEFATLYESFNEMLSKIGEHSNQQEKDRLFIEKQNDELKATLKRIEEINKELFSAKYKAEESDRLKSLFLANMSHEIRTPMNGILGFTNLLSQPGLTKEQISSYIGIVKRSGERLMNTINDLIDISKIEAGQMTVNITQFELNAVFDEMYHFFKPETDEKGLQLNLTKALPANLSVIKTDKIKLEAILINLIKNSIKFTPKGQIDFGYTVDGNQLEIFVKDTGIGIPGNKQKEIFERFVQVELDYTKPYEGSGLGLTICKGYLDLMKGKISLESEVTKGTSFYIHLPVEIKKTSKPEQTGGATDNCKHFSKKLNLCIVDDDNTSAEYITNIFKEDCQKIIRAKNGKEAVEICKQDKNIDVVIMDIKMPVMNGLDATKEIRFFNKEIPIIAQTAYAFETEKWKCLDAGCTDYITKPFNRQSIVAMIEKYTVQTT